MPNESNRLIYAGLLGLSVATVLQCLQLATLSLAILISLYAFAIAVPFLAVGLIADYAQRDGRPIPFWADLVGVLGGLASLIGFGATFFHFDIIVGGIFCSTTILSLVMVRRF